MSNRPPASPDSTSSSKKSFKQAFKRPFFARRGTSGSAPNAKTAPSSLSSSQTEHSQTASSSTAQPDSKLPPSSDPPAQQGTVRWKDHASKAADQDATGTYQKSPRRDSTSSSGSSSQGAGHRSERTPVGGPSNYFGSAIGTPTPTLGASAPISSLHFVQTLNTLLLEPATLALSQLAPPSVLAIPWTESPYGKQSVEAPSSTSLSTYISQTSTDHGTAAMSASSQQSYGCNEQLAASALSMPSVSVAALWRAVACMQWINESADTFCQSIDNAETTSYMDAKNPVPEAKHDVEGVTSPDGWPTTKDAVFEIGGLLQNLMDVLSSTAAKHDVELVLYHGRDPSAEPPLPNEFRPEGGLRELHCRGDDAGLGTAIMAIVCKILQQSQPGDTIEVGLSLTCLATGPDLEELEESNLYNSQAQKPTSIHSKLEEEEDEEEGTPWEATLDVSHSCGPEASELVDAHDPFAQDLLIKLLTKGNGIRINAMNPQSAGRRSWPVSIKLQQTVPPAQPPDVPMSSGSSQRPKHLAELSKEPSVADLIRFSETFLRGKKAIIHSAEQSLFAKHMTGYLAMWGLHPTHVPLETQKDEEAHTDGATGNNEPARDAEGFMRPSRSQPQSPPLDPTVNFIFIDDDISTLRRQLVIIKNSAPQLQLPNTLLSKRPGLQSRRTRSSAHIKPNANNSNAHNSHLAVIYCTSLSKFRFIRELVQSIFRSVSPAFPLPEVFVLPKPVGPRRLLTALHTSIKKPFLDAAVLPIATSPSSPGGHFFVSPSSRPSPAPSSHQDFDSAFGAHAHAVEQSNSFAVPKTPPYVPAPLAPAAGPPAHADPPSPRTSSSEAVEYLEYMSKTSKDLGSDSSSGIVIQSQDGTAQGLYFRPKRNSMGHSIGSITRPTMLSSDLVRPERQGTAEEKSEDGNPPASPVTDADPVTFGTPQNPPALLQVVEGSPVSPERPTASEGNKSFEHAEHDSPPSLPAVTPNVIGHTENGYNVGSPQPMATMSPPLEAGDRALPLDAFTPVAHLPNSGRSISDNSVPTTPLTRPPPSFNRTITAPSALPLTLKPSMQRSDSGATDAPPASPPPSLPTSPPPQTTSPKSPPPATSSSKPASPAQAAAQSEHVSSIAGPPATILARSAGRKPRNENGKNKRKAATPVVPPVNVLIVEDNRIEQVVVSTFLRRHGIRCSVAANGQEAVDKWKTGGFHLVLMDIQLPVKSGMEATMEIRELERANNIAAFQMTPTTEGTPESGIHQQLSGDDPSKLGAGVNRSTVSAATSPHQLPVIIVALTASSLPADRISALAAGCNDFITKPVSHKWLHQKVLEWGSMSYLSSFKRTRTPATSPASTLLQAGLAFDRAAAQSKAQEIAASLHIDRKPKEPSPQSEQAPAITGTPPLSRPELSAFQPGSSGSISKESGSPRHTSP